MTGCEKGYCVYDRVPSPLGRRQVNGHCLQGGLFRGTIAALGFIAPRVAECAKKPHYTSKHLGDRLHIPHGRGARRVAVVERPCLRDDGGSRGWLRKETPTTEDEETEIVTVLTHTLQSKIPTYQERKEKTEGISKKAGPQES